MNHGGFITTVSVPVAGAIELNVSVVGKYDHPDVESPTLAEFLAGEILDARESYQAWPNIGDELFGADGHVTFVIIGRVFQSPKSFSGLRSVQFVFRQRADGEIPAYMVMP